MPFASKVVLPLPLGAPGALGSFVEQCLADGVRLVCLVGPGADEAEHEIDWLVVGDASDKNRFLVTTAHPDEPLSRVMEFAKAWDGDHNLAGESR